MTSTLAQVHTVQIGDIEMYYEETGGGQPLVLLHGFGGSSRNWRPFANRLAERHRLILVDLRGHGNSTNGEHRFSHRQAAEDVFRTLATEPIAQRRHNPGLDPGRVDVIVGGAVIVVSILRHFGFPEMLVSETDILDGLARSLA